MYIIEHEQMYSSAIILYMSILSHILSKSNCNLLVEKSPEYYWQ